MTDEMGASSLICAALEGLEAGRRVSLKLDGEPGWIEIRKIGTLRDWPGLFEVERAGGQATLMAPIPRLVAIEVG